MLLQNDLEVEKFLKIMYQTRKRTSISIDVDAVPTTTACCNLDL